MAVINKVKTISIINKVEDFINKVNVIIVS